MLQDSLPFFDWPEQMQKEVSGDKDAGSSHGDHVKKKNGIQVPAWPHQDL